MIRSTPLRVLTSSCIGDLVRRAFLEDASHSDVQAFRVLPEYDKVDVLALEIAQRAKPVVEAADRTQVHVQVEPETGTEKDVPRMTHIRNARVAEGPHEDRIKGLELLQRGIGQCLPGLQEPIGTVIEMLHLEFERDGLGGGLEDLHRFARHVNTDPVAGKHRVSPLHLLPR